MFLGLDNLLIQLPVDIQTKIIFGGEFMKIIPKIERYLGVLKKYVRNKSKPEGSIAEGYLADECLTFCARFLNDGEKKPLNEAQTSNAEKGGYPIGLGKMKKRERYTLT